MGNPNFLGECLNLNLHTFWYIFIVKAGFFNLITSLSNFENIDL